MCMSEKQDGPIDINDPRAPVGIKQEAWETASPQHRIEMIGMLADYLNDCLADVSTRAYVGGMGWG